MKKIVGRGEHPPHAPHIGNHLEVEGVPPNSQISALISSTWKHSPSRLLPLQLTFIPPPLSSFLVVDICSFTTFLLTSYFLYTQVMLIKILIDVQYLQKADFSFENGLNSQNYSFSGAHHRPPIKIFPPSRISHSHWETSPAPLLNNIWKTVIYKDWLNLIICHI